VWLHASVLETRSSVPNRSMVQCPSSWTVDGYPGNVRPSGFWGGPGGPWTAQMVQVDLMDHNRMPEIEDLEDRESFSVS
jgi:hypothetical protein